jgi:hypothetical protein
MVYEKLNTLKKPLHYKEIFEKYTVHNSTAYSENTKPDETLRLHYAQHKSNDILLLPGTDGHIGLFKWFPNIKNDELIRPDIDRLQVDPNLYLAYDSGYEYKSREQFLKDFNSDRMSERRYNITRNAFIVESHIKGYFQSNFPDNYIESDNHKKYDKGCDHDFKLKFSGRVKKIDVKYSAKDSQYQIRFPKKENDFYYIFGSIDGNNVWISGFKCSSFLEKEEIDDSYYNKRVMVNRNNFWSADCLVAQINIYNMGFNYSKIHTTIFKNYY